MRALGTRRWQRLALSLVFAATLSLTVGFILQQPWQPMWQGGTVAQAAGIEVRFIDDDGNALRTQDIRLLCFQGQLDANPDDLRFVTTSAGTMPVSLPAGCTHVAALRLWHTQPSSKPGHGPAYWVYTTSWRPGSSDLVALGTGEATAVTISDENTLVLFNVVIGLAWQPPESSDYVANLLKGMGENSVVNGGESAVSFLYDLTDGTMSFGPVTVHVDGKEWESTDIRIVPANDLRPSAQVGGIVAESFNFTSTVFVTATTVYSPGAITLGRNWVACAPPTGSSTPAYLISCSSNTGVTDTIKLFGASDAVALGGTIKYGNWDDAPGFRTIVHEWAHYALFLYDEYQSVQAQAVDCTTPDNKRIINDGKNASAMDWHYTASEFWHELPVPGECAATKQYQFHGLTDCETLAAWYTIQQLPNASTLPPLGCAGEDGGPGPDTLGITKFLFGRMPPVVTLPPVRPYSIFLPGLRFGPFQVIPPEIERAATVQNVIDAPVQVSADIARAVEYAPPRFLHTYQLRPDGAESYDRIWYHGKVISDVSNADIWTGHVTVLGAQEKIDQVKIFGESYATDVMPGRGGRWFGATTVNTNTEVQVFPDFWSASLDLEYEVSDQGQVVTVTSHVTMPVFGALSPDQIKAGIQICSPDADVRCYWNQPLTFVSSNGTQEYWRTRISPQPGDPTLPNYGIVRLHVLYDYGNGEVERRELISWYKTSGVGPGSYNALAPTPPNEDDVVTLFSETVRRHCNQLVFSAATNADILTASLGKTEDGQPFMGLVGPPIDIAVRLPLQVGGSACPQQFGQGSRKIAQQDVYLTLAYNHLYEVAMQDLIRDELTPAMEDNLHILFYNPDSGWEPVLPLDTTRDAEMNWISVPFTQDGIYAIGWAAP